MARFTVICFLLGLMQVWAIDSYSQVTRLSLTAKSERLANVLERIEKQSDYFFLYNRDLVDVEQLVSIQTENQTIGSILNNLFEGKDISYFMFDRQIVLTNRKSVEEAVTQQRAVLGTVTDSKGLPLPAVTVVIKGTTRGAITGNNGSYTIANIPADATLVFSFVGMKTQEIVVGNSSTINVVMEEASIGIEDVVAIGYGSMRRKDLTGSVSSVTASDLTEKPVTNFVQALQGKAAGLSVISSHGEPGAEMIIRIRGGNSLKNDNKPLIVVDGIPTDIDLNSIAPEDIKSIDILKDASSTAIYGSRGANGVMMITTNRGSVGKPSINFSTYMGFDQLRNKLTVLNGREYAELANERYKISGLQPKYSEAFLRDSTAGSDWQDELFRTGPVKNYQLSVSGGNKDIKYFLSLGNFDQDGIIINSYFKRYTTRLNIEANLSKRLRMMPSVDISRTKLNSNSRQASVVYNSLLASPLDNVSTDGEYYLDPVTGEQTADVTPVKLAMERINQRTINYINLSLPVYYDILPNLTFMTRFGYSYSQTLINQYIPLKIVDNPSETSASIGNSFANKFLNENTLSFNKKIGIHNVNLLAGVTFEEYNSENVTARASGFESDNLLYHNLSAATILLQPWSGISRTALVSGLFRVNYSLKDKYIFTATGRWDGSSKFGKDHKWGFFPSSAVAWHLGEEDFIRDLNVFDNLKIRASYGISGNQSFPPYSSLDLRGETMTVFGDRTFGASYPSTMANSNLAWETTAQLDLGLEASFLRNRLSLVFDYYNKYTNRLMLDKQIPYYTGFTSIVDNVGKLENKGFEFTAEGRILDGDFKWFSSLNYTNTRNKVLSLANDATMIPGMTEGSGNYAGIINNMIIVGQPLGTFYGYKTNGIYQWGEDLSVAPKQPNGQVSQPGDVRYVDVTGPDDVPDGVISDLDRVILGSAQPKWIGGFSNTFSYKNFDLTIFAHAIYGNKVFNMSLFRMYSMTADDWNSLSIVKDRWRAPQLDNSGNPVPGTGNPSNTVPRLLKTNENPYIHLHDRFILDGSFLRVKNVTLGYSIPEKLLKKVNISHFRVYCDLQNFFTWSNYLGYDPEVSDFGDNNRGLGIDKYTYPKSKTWILGLQMRF